MAATQQSNGTWKRRRSGDGDKDGDDDDDDDDNDDDDVAYVDIDPPSPPMEVDTTVEVALAPGGAAHDCRELLLSPSTSSNQMSWSLTLTLIHSIKRHL